MTRRDVEQLKTTVRIKGDMSRDRRRVEQQELDRRVFPHPFDTLDDLSGLPDWHLVGEGEWMSTESAMRQRRERHLELGLSTIDCPKCGTVCAARASSQGNIVVMGHYSGWGERCKTRRYPVSSRAPSLRASIGEQIAQKRHSVYEPCITSVAIPHFAAK